MKSQRSIDILSSRLLYLLSIYRARSMVPRFPTHDIHPETVIPPNPSHFPGYYYGLIPDGNPTPYGTGYYDPLENTVSNHNNPPFLPTVTHPTHEPFLAASPPSYAGPSGVSWAGMEGLPVSSLRSSQADPTKGLSSQARPFYPHGSRISLDYDSEGFVPFTPSSQWSPITPSTQEPQSASGVFIPTQSWETSPIPHTSTSSSTTKKLSRGARPFFPNRYVSKGSTSNSEAFSTFADHEAKAFPEKVQDGSQGSLPIGEKREKESLVENNPSDDHRKEESATSEHNSELKELDKKKLELAMQNY